MTIRKQSVLVSNASSDCGIAAIRSLSRAGFEVFGCDSRRLPLGLRSRYLKNCFELDGSSQEAFEEALLELVEELRPDVLLPIGSRSMRAVCRNLETLSSITAVNAPDHDSFMAAYDKIACMADCRRLGIPCPQSYEMEEAADVLNTRPGITTLVVKPHYDAGAANGVSFVRDVESLRADVQVCQERYGGVLIQDYVEGGAAAMRSVILLFSRNSQLFAAFTFRKLRQWPLSGGTTAVGVSTTESHLLDQVLPFFQQRRWRGAAEVELKFDARDGSFKVIEINPRFPAYLRFPIQCGLDLPNIAAQLSLLDEPSPPVELPTFETGATYVCPGLLVKSLVAEIRGGGSMTRIAGNAIGQLRSSVNCILDMFSDPLPLIGRALVD